jgi:hypothetical protein
VGGGYGLAEIVAYGTAATVRPAWLARRNDQGDCHGDERVLEQ